VVIGASRVGRLPARDARIAELTIEPLCAPESIHALCLDEESKSGLGTVVDGLFHARRDEFSDWLVASLTGERAPHDSAMAVGSNECRYPTIAMISAAAPIAMSANAIPNKRGRFCTADSRLAASAAPPAIKQCQCHGSVFVFAGVGHNCPLGQSLPPRRSRCVP